MTEQAIDDYDFKEKVEELNKTILPKGVTLTPYYVKSDFVHDSIRSVTESLLIGLLLAIVVFATITGVTPRHAS